MKHFLEMGVSKWNILMTLLIGELVLGMMTDNSYFVERKFGKVRQWIVLAGGMPGRMEEKGGVYRGSGRLVFLVFVRIGSWEVIGNW